MSLFTHCFGDLPIEEQEKIQHTLNALTKVINKELRRCDDEQIIQLRNVNEV